MNQGRLLILDLDDTIFETRSIGTNHLKSIFSQFRKVGIDHYSSKALEEIENDLWHLPFDQVVSKHQFPIELSKLLPKLINETNFKFNIQPFSDFKHLQSFPYPKVLVTTGFKHLQEAKISALGIASAFEAIYIDEIDAPNRLFKSGIFKQIIESSELMPEQHVVIGDNPESELKAGKALGLTTIQMARSNQPNSPYSLYRITNFAELELT
ncbi:MAG: HAD family hydrolase [Cytophagales bacterium]|nr:HAD family hydrolase [Cytophagales bacterium]